MKIYPCFYKHTVEVFPDNLSSNAGIMFFVRYYKHLLFNSKYVIGMGINGCFGRKKNHRDPGPIFVDCSCGNDTQLRKLAEESMNEFLRRLERFPILMMCLRILMTR